MCDIAADKGVNKILVDCLALTGELAAFERYRLGAETAESFTERLMKKSRHHHQIIFDSAGSVEMA
jgi:hypothetical protein